MQDQGDRPARPGRPSLISSAPQPEPERQRILSSLDGKPAPAGAAARSAPRADDKGGKPGALVWGGVGLGAIAIAAGLYSLLGSNAPDEPPPVLVATAPATTAAAVPPAAAPAAAPVVPTPGPVAAAEPAAAPSAAAELHDTPDPVAANPLADMAPAPVKSVAKKDHLTQALEKPSKEKAREHKLAENKKPVPKKPKEKAPAKAAPKPVDNDVTLLAALMAHMEPRQKKATPAEQLKICKQYNAAGEEQCRAHLCATDARKEPECKSAKTASNI